MTYFSYFFSFTFYFCTLVLLRSSLHVHGEEAKTHHVFSVRSSLPGAVCSSAKGPNSATLKILHRHGPCSPFQRHEKPNHQQILSLDQARVDSLHHRISAASKRETPVGGSLATTIPAHSGGSFGTGNYIVTLGFGTPKKDLSVIFDTGSDLTWIQCKPCSQCYPQAEAMFDPTQSSTYHNFSCTSTECSQLDVSACSSSVCQYAVEYGDNSQTKGSYVQDTLTLTPSDVLPNFQFGCGHDNTGLFGTAAGLLGLGRASVSLVSQSASKYGKVFTYCLPSVSSSAGYLTLGDGGTTSNAKFTPMLTYDSIGSYYFLKLVAISVGGQNLAIPPMAFSKPGTILDSGTVITRLPPSAYPTLRSTFRNLMSSYPMAPPLAILDTCYDLSNYSTVNVPTVALQFDGGVDVNLDVTGILYVASMSQACLAFAANDDADDLVIIGNVQQRTINVVYDVANLNIGFVPQGCS